MTARRYDVVVLGSGPAGHAAATTASRAGKSVLLIEESRTLGGNCVRFGTIPSKTLRETAVALSLIRRKTGAVFNIEAREELQIAALMVRLEEVVRAHERSSSELLTRFGIDVAHGRARFIGRNTIEVRAISGERDEVTASSIFIATGSVPRTPPDVPVDHEHILDSDSILSMRYLPRTLIVIGGGVIACEYASIFTALGVNVTMVDRAKRPLGFLDADLTDHFVRRLANSGGRYVGNATLKSVEFDGISHVGVALENGPFLHAEKVFCALGRVAKVDSLSLESAGISLSDRGFVPVDGAGRTSVPGIYAIGDVAGPPSLAAAATEQGRRAVQHWLGAEVRGLPASLPVGVYAIPELACVGLNEDAAREAHGRDVVVGRVGFGDLARGQIGANEDGALKLVALRSSGKILGVHIAGEGACELLAIGQLAIDTGFTVERLVETVFNFPTLAEAYRVAGLDILLQMSKQPRGSQWPEHVAA